MEYYSHFLHMKFYCICIINNMDMIKISHVMTDYTIKFIFMCVCV